MFSKILGGFKGKDKDSDMFKAVSKMNLTDMRTYINNRVPNIPICEDGLNEVIKKLIHVDKNSSKRYIEIDDMDIKKKKGFDLVLTMLTSKKITLATIELVNEFLELFQDIIEKYDEDNKEIYHTRIRDAVVLATGYIDTKANVNRKIDVLVNN